MADIGTDRDPDLVHLDDPAPAGGNEPGVVELADDGDDDAKLPPQAVQRADGTICLPLRTPVTLKFKRGADVREETFSEFVFHALNGADMRVITARPATSMTATAIARSTRLPEGKVNAVYDRMDARDVNAAERCVMHFMDGGRPTGR